MEPPYSSRTCYPSEPPHSTGASPLEPPPGVLGTPPAALNELQAVQLLPPWSLLLWSLPLWSLPQEPWAPPLQP